MLRGSLIIMLLGGVAVAGVAKPVPASQRPNGPRGPQSKAAEPSPPAAPDPGTAEQAGPEAGAEAAAIPRHITGPKLVDLGNNTQIDVPAGMILFERAEAQDLLRKGGNSAESTVAIVVKPGSQWLVDIDYEASGYVDDSDAGELDAGELLASYQAGTREQNARRKELGKPELVIDSWTEPPRYEPVQRHLVWGLSAHDSDGKVVNFFTRILGRSGYLSVNLIDAPERIEASKQDALAILAATRFTPGARYEDHVSDDKSSGIGLRGLVLGGAGIALAGKLGFLAKILFALKKGFILIAVAFGGLWKRLFRRKSRDGIVTGSPVVPAPDLAPAVAVETASVMVPLTKSSVDPPPDGTPHE